MLHRTHVTRIVCLSRFRLFDLDESKSLFPYDSRPTGTEKVRFDTEALDQSKDRDGTTAMSSGTHEGRTTGGSRSTNAYRIRRQQSSDSSLTGSPRKKTEKIRNKEALDIMVPYHARYRIRSGGKHFTCSDNVPRRFDRTRDDTSNEHD
jgi:hypothetical protein